MIKAKAKQWVLFAVMLLLGGGLFIWLIWKEEPQLIWENVMSFGLWPLLGFILISLINMSLLTWRWQLIVHSYRAGKQLISFPRMLMHQISGFAFNYLTPIGYVGGEPIRIALLTRDGIPVRQATSATIIDTTFNVLTFVLFAVLGVIFTAASGLIEGNKVWLVIGGGLLLFALVVGLLWLIALGHGVFEFFIRALRLNRITWMKKASAEVIRIEHLLTRFLRGHKRLILAISGMSVMSYAIRVFEVWYIALFLGLFINFGEAFITSTFPGLALFLPVPAGVGVFEGSFALVFTLLGLPLSAIVYAGILRLRDLIFILVGVVHALMQGRSWIAQKLRKE